MSCLLLRSPCQREELKEKGVPSPWPQSTGELFSEFISSGSFSSSPPGSVVTLSFLQDEGRVVVQ